MIFSKLKTYIIYILLILIIISSGSLLFYKHKAKQYKHERDNVKDELVVKTKENKTYKNKLGQIVTKTINYEKTIKELSLSNDSIELKMAKVIQASDLKVKQIKKATSIIINSHTSILRDTLYVPISDTIYNVIFPLHYKNKWEDALAYKDSLVSTTYRNIIVLDARRRVPRKFWLWRKLGFKKIINKGMVEVVSDNPTDSIKLRTINIIK